MIIIEFQEYWLLVLIVGSRTTAFLMMLPFFRGRSIPVLAKTSIILSISLFVARSLEPVQIETLPELFGVLAFEIIVGFVLAYMIELIFSIVRVAGSLIDMDIGLSNPFFDSTTNSQSTSISRLFYYVFLMIFLLIGGLETVITGFVYTFQFQLKNDFLSDISFLDYMLETFNYMFFGALQIAIPFMMSTFLVYISLLLMSKSVDKINILMNIFGVKIFVGLAMILLCVPVLIIVFEQANEILIEKFFELIGLMFER